jgi:putative transposase
MMKRCKRGSTSRSGSSKLHSTGSKNKLGSPLEHRRQWVEPHHERISVRRQCQLLGVNRSGLYYQAVEERAENLHLMRLLDEQYTRCPFYGVRRLTAWVQQQGYSVNAKRVRRWLRQMGLMAVYPKPRLSPPDVGAQLYPYVLTGRTIERSDQVWSTDITDVRLSQGFVYLVAIMDWYSRYVLAWEVSVTLDSHFCVSALERALSRRQPEIFTSDQGAQFTSLAFTAPLLAGGILISMDGRGRVFDNIFVERLWRRVKYEEVYLKDYRSVPEAIHGLWRYFESYNRERLHQSLNYQTPATVYRQGQQWAAGATLN